ncbi:MAG: hypothetical protein LUD46_08485 [Parabacteroides sp.]|nr:hypothetical protein [Parabacteroides sp.]
MEIITIFTSYIYSIKNDGQDENEFDRLLAEWNDVESVAKFLKENQDYLKTDVWKIISEPEAAALQVLDEAEALEMLFEELNKHTEVGEKPDFDSHFHYLEGKYKYELKYPPMKSYGEGSPSLLRLYAIKMGKNTYLITGGGIKLADTIQNSPGLREHILQNIDRVRSWLKSNGIMDNEDMEIIKRYAIWDLI